MKKICLSALTAILVIGGANAEYYGIVTTVEEPVVQQQQQQKPVKNHTKSMGKGGFVGGDETIVTIAQVNEMRDGVPVVVVGQIIQRMGDDKYLFQDGTDSITIEIDDDGWRGQTVNETDTVKIYGDVDRGIFDTEIDVDYVEKI
jgi:uncharacterized protein (TIGR00156 family)